MAVLAHYLEVQLMSERTEHRPTQDSLFAGTAEDQTESTLPGVIGRTVTVDRPRGDLYGYCRNLSNLPVFMSGLDSVNISADGRHARWTHTEGKPGDGKDKEGTSWQTAIIVDEPNQAIGWRTSAGSRIEHEGRLEFKDAPGGRGTLVSATIAYRQVGGSVGGLLARVFHRDPRIQTQRDLRRFKQLMETGEVATAQPPAAAPRA
jgi:uncharacterized membrane protein